MFREIYPIPYNNPKHRFSFSSIFLLFSQTVKSAVYSDADEANLHAHVHVVKLFIGLRDERFDIPIINTLHLKNDFGSI